jgi:hypothetical protein
MHISRTAVRIAAVSVCSLCGDRERVLGLTALLRAGTSSRRVPDRTLTTFQYLQAGKVDHAAAGGSRAGDEDRAWVRAETDGTRSHAAIIEAVVFSCLSEEHVRGLATLGS